MTEDISGSVAKAKKEFAEFLEKDTTWTGVTKLFNLTISIPSHTGRSAGLGLDTTKMFASLKPEQQYGHSVKMVPMKPTATSYYYGDNKRKGRQQDVVVSAVSEMTERRWRADIDKTNTIVLSINKAPIKVRQKQKDQLIKDLETLLKLVSVVPEIKIPD